MNVASFTAVFLLLFRFGDVRALCSFHQIAGDKAAELGEDLQV
jgi:hypothetical protein